MQKDGDVPKSYNGEYSTDMVSRKAKFVLDEAIHARKPFFLGITPVGPHAEMVPDGFGPPIPAQRHQNLYRGLKAPRTPNFNPDVVSSPSRSLLLNYELLASNLTLL